MCAQAGREEVEYIRRHRRYTRVSRETCLRETGKAPIKTGRRLTRGNQGSPTLTRGESRRNIRHEGVQELYVSTPPLEALKVVLSEIATGTRGGKVMALEKSVLLRSRAKKSIRRTTT